MTNATFYLFCSRVIGHFTAMVNDKSTAVGCGYSTFKTIINSIQFNSYLFACNYATTNIIGCPVYKSGDKGSLCVGGTDNIFNGLCKSTESIDANLLCWYQISVGVENCRWKFNFRNKCFRPVYWLELCWEGNLLGFELIGKVSRLRKQIPIIL